MLLSSGQNDLYELFLMRNYVVMDTNVHPAP